MKRYRAFGKDENGTKQEIVADSIIIELEENKTLELDLKPHEKYFGGLPIITPAEIEIMSPDKISNHFAFNIKPGACNVIHLFIENHIIE